MRVLFRWVAVAVGVPGAIAAGGLILGWTLPEKIEVTRSILINRPPENVFWVLNDYTGLAVWHPQYRSSRMLSNPGEKPVRWRATYTDGRAADIVVSEDNPPLRYAERIADANLPFSGAWTLEMERRDLTTRVTAHSIAELHRPLDRLFVRMFVKPDVELQHILDGLKRRVESATVKPTAATS